MIKIAITGPESSGKTTFCQLLAKELNCQWIPEYAREYLENKSEYSLYDLDLMAQEQCKRWQSVENQSLVIYDTEMLVYKIWSQVKFGQTTEVIDKLYLKQEIDHYFLCKPDIPWEYDPLRENPENRDELFEMYLKELEDKNRPFSILAGNLENRILAAKETIGAKFRSFE
jgi:nicotinamide riboside kinase